MKIAVFAYSRQGCKTALRVMDFFEGNECRAFTMERFLTEGKFSPIQKPSLNFYGELFSWADGLIFVGSCGIAVRQIAPHLKDKKTDPAVLCVDELATFVISLLSGHIGGANEVTAKLAAALGATPVITTATDINHRFSVDAWAAKQGMCIDSMKAAKAVSAEILEREVSMKSDLPVTTPLPSGVKYGENGKVGILISWKKEQPFEETLRLIPRVLHVGIGCRKGISTEAIREVVESVFSEYDIDRRAVKCAASIDLKAKEQGLLEFCAENDWPVSFYTAEQLQAVEGEFTPSRFVQSVTGVDNVCERAALLGARRLIVKKTAQNGVTVAVAEEYREVFFE